MIDVAAAETPLGLRELKLFAMASKVLLMAGVGSRFSSEDDKQELNDFLGRASPYVLRLLDSITVRRGAEECSGGASRDA